MNTRDKVFTTITVLTTLITIGIGINWFSDSNPTSLSDFFISIPLITLGCLFIDSLMWEFITLIVYTVVYIDQIEF